LFMPPCFKKRLLLKMQLQDFKKSLQIFFGPLNFLYLYWPETKKDP